MNKIRNEKGEIITDNKEVQRIVKNYYKQICGKKFDNLVEMNNF